MPPIDLLKMTKHATIDRRQRFDLIEKTVGWGYPVITATDKMGRDATATITTTGVIIIRTLENYIITAYIADVKQAEDIFQRATGSRKMPHDLWNVVNYNNNTPYWKAKTAA